MNARNDRLELLRRCIDAEASDKELAQLEELLRDEPEFREEYLLYLNVDSGLATMPITANPLDKTSKSLVTFPKWRRYATPIAAGLVFGLFCASIAWAIAVPRTPEAVVIPILSESFENLAIPIADGFPSRAGQWGGDRTQIVGAGAGREPLDGDSVLSLESSTDSNLGFLQQVIDVSSLPQTLQGEMRVVEVIASFLADQPGEEERYTLRVAAFKESPESIRSLWEGVHWRDLDKIALTFSKTGLSAAVDAEDWQTLSALVEVPVDSHSVVISLAAGRLDRAAPKTPHYIDDIRAELRIIPFKKRLCRKRK